MSDTPPLSVPDEVDAADLAPALAVGGLSLDDETIPTPEVDAVDPEGPTAAAAADADADAGPAPDEAGSRVTIDGVLGVVRVGVGAALVIAPGWAGRVWVGPGADGPGSLVLARALGARDVALGLRILDGVRKGEPVGHWVAAGFAADAADVAATLVAGRHLTPTRRIAMPLIAGVVGALGVWSGRRSGA